MALAGIAGLLSAGTVPGPVIGLAVDPLAPATLYAVADVTPVRPPTYVRSQLFGSDDGGATWHPLTTPAFDPTSPLSVIESLAVDPQVRGILYAASSAQEIGVGFVYPGYVFKSTDGGLTWTKVFDRTNEPGSIRIDPASSSTVYVGANSVATALGIFKSVDSGADWFDVSPPGFDACRMLGIDPVNPSVVYSGGCYVTPVYRSTDGAATWKPAATGLPAAFSLDSFAIAPSRPTTLYAGMLLGGVFRSIDSGDHWTTATAGIANKTIFSLAVDPRFASVAYAGTPDGLFKTTSGGALWSPAGVSDVAINTIVIDHSSPDTVYVGTSAGAFKSVDAGATWLPINTGLPFASIISPVPAAVTTPIVGRP
jgi:photosystem II stability/assembly factor-like uncharacterized protein